MFLAIEPTSSTSDTSHNKAALIAILPTVPQLDNDCLPNTKTTVSSFLKATVYRLDNNRFRTLKSNRFRNAIK